MPDPLLTRSGEKVRTAGDWKSLRRPEVLELFRQNVYGRAPVGRPAQLRFEILDAGSEAMDGKATRKLVQVRYAGPGGEGSFQLILFTPKTARPSPCMLLICNRGKDNID